MYTQEDLQEMPEQHLLNIMTSVCDSGVPEYLKEMRQCRAELTRRGKKVLLVRVYDPSKWKWVREAQIVDPTK